ncbi:MAG: hypothetical protein LUC91_07065 [Prevotella sp.]|nr:hypothetical protein [Prevotella sp.]
MKTVSMYKYDNVNNTTKSTVWGVANRLMILFSEFILRAIIIRVLGAEYLGLSGLFTSILQVLNMAELGFSSAIVYSMYKPIAEGNTDEICALVALYKKVYRIIGCVILVIGLVILPLLPKLISGTNSTNLNIYILYLISLSSTVSSYFLFAYRNCLFAAHQRNDVTNAVSFGLMVPEQLQKY